MLVLALLILFVALPEAAEPQAAAPPPATGAQAPGDKAPADPSTAAPAQDTSSTWTDVGYLGIDAGYQAGSAGFSHTFSFPQYAEQATIDTRYPKKDGPTFNVAWTFRVWRNFAAGLAVGAVNRSTQAPVTGSIPHPLHPSTPRAVSSSAGIERSETGVHVQLGYVLPAGRLLLAITGGPSYFVVKQSLVDAVQVSESPSSDTATVLPITPSTVTESTIGFNVGGDVGYYFTRALGVGVLARYARGVVALPVRGNSVSTKAGGFQVAAGLRLRLPRTSGTKAPGKPPTKPVRPGPVKKGPGR